MDVVGVKRVQVGGAAGAFAGGAEGDLAETADLAEDRGSGGLFDLPDLPIALFDQEAAGGEALDFAGDAISGRGRSEGFLAPGRGSAGGPASEPIDTAAEFGAGPEGVGVQLAGGDGMPEAGLDAAAALVPEFVGEQGGSKTRVNEAGDVKKGAVLAGEVEREGARGGLLDQPGGGGMPLGILDANAAEVEVGDFSGGEDNEKASLAEPVNRGAERAGIGAAGALVAEGVDQNQAVAHLRDGAEEGVGEDSDIGADAVHQRHGSDAVNEAEGAVGDNDDGAAGGHPGEIGGRDLQFDVELPENVLGEAGGGRRLGE